MTNELVSNFEFLKEHDPIFFQLTHNAEKIFAIDPNASLMKVRQFGEAVAQDIASQVGLLKGERENQLDLLNRLRSRLDIDQTILQLFHALRKEGNVANHQFTTTFKQAMDALKSARAIAIWYHQTFSKNAKNFKAGPFILPPDPSAGLKELEDQIQQLKAKLQDNEQSQEQSSELAELIKEEAAQHNQLKAKLAEDAEIYEQLLQQQEAETARIKAEFEAKVKSLTIEAERLKREKEQLANVKQQTKQATKQLHLSEAETRLLIDVQLTEAGWQADTQTINFKNGSRPEKGKNIAIAEWPTSSGPADYVLFAGLIPIAVVEAKKEIKDVGSAIPQAERYAATFKAKPNYQMAWAEEGRTIAWPQGDSGHYHIPFVYACNGRPYVKQFKEKSGIWFRDVREPSNLRKALQDFHSPKGLLDNLTRSKEAAEQKLKAESFSYLDLRDYQIKAIQAVEAALEQERNQALLAMATGTGKTRTIIGLIYRFLKAERFKRILFLVDRTSLGNQAFDSFKEAKLEQEKSLTQIYNINDLGDMAAEAETRVHVATVQAMVKRVFYSDNKPTIDTYDCIIVDEAHRGYTLDTDMGEGEALIRDSAQYMSSYRRVIDYFDAFKVGLTATPAAHTTEIFGKPVYTYSYREAVADDWLIDHEPPYQYRTELNQGGVSFKKGEQVDVVNVQTGEVDTAELEDELNFDVESFNRNVITPEFDAVVAKAFAHHFDIGGEEKGMVFCVNEAHAQRFKNELDAAFKALHEEDYNQDIVRVITGQTDKVPDAIKRYKNETNPRIAITVDLLTTGIDVPPITHLLFMRRVKSRILYEQMKGRATRRCDEIGKTVFYIHDPVALYESLEAVDTMKPLVKDPNITLTQLVDEIQQDASFDVPGTQQGTSHAHDVLDQISQKVMRVLRKAEKKAEDKPELKTKLDELHELWGVEPNQLHKHLHELGPQQARTFLGQHQNLINQLEEVKNLIGSALQPYIYQGEDKLINIEQGYGIGEKKPGDFLEDFNQFVKQQVNQHAAIKVVCTKPAGLTREQLKEIKLLLDNHGYSEANLKSAWRNQTNQEIAASIIGHIRQAALGEPLIDFSDRVKKAMQGIYALHKWTPAQRKWLDRLAAQLVHEVVIDEAFVNKEFADAGGYKRLNKVLDNQLDQVIVELKEHLWEAS
ncbi:type I restriction-modification system endonuclease [Reinekea sp. G2M2-21]|uniref:type I restriction-modification system endonuclease n=1 Tax=Reinekea sp. G2M2-21 TaxID=2788942 RepID=UPI0018AC3E1D|nr:type I restriction-modification system endonuclease [Reinekea sp. G2M2-21]